MGLGSKFGQEEEQEENNDGESKVAYIYIRSDDNLDAYHLMSKGLGGSAEVRDDLKNLPMFQDQHDFFQQFVVNLQPVLDNDNYSDLLDFLMVDANNIAQYLDENEEVMKELMELLNTHQEAAEEVAEADD